MIILIWGGLRYYYDEPGIDSIFWNVDYTEKFKMMSYCYRYNSCWLQLLSDNIHPLQSSNKGYKPVDKRLPYKHRPNIGEKKENAFRYDSLKLYYMERLINECKSKGTVLVFAISPQFETFTDQEYLPLKKLCAKYKIPLLNHFCDKAFVTTPDYFYDSMHMNRTGATLYTRILTEELKLYLNINKKNG